MKLRISESNYLIEDIEAVKKYYPNIDDNTFMELISLDPTYRGKDSLGKYGKWVLNLYNKKQISDRDFDDVTKILDQFTIYRNRIQNKDLNAYKTLDDLSDILAQVVDDDSMLSDRQKLRFRKNVKAGRISTEAEDDYDVVFEDNQYIVYVPNTHEASMKLGKGTQWCTAHENPKWYDDYTRNSGKLYIIKDKSSGNMWQYSDRTASFLDQNDKVFDYIELLHSDDELLYFFSKILNYDLKDNKGIFTYNGTNPIPMLLRDKIKKVIILDGVEKIPDSCFAYCENLSEIIIPKSVNFIGTNAFIKTRFLRIKQKENPLVIINNILVNADYVSGKVMLPNNLISISPSVFSEIDITEIIIPEKIKEISDCLFYDCSVNKVKLPKKLRSIGNSSFYNCTNLKKLVIPDTVEFIGSNAFEDCDSLTIYTKNDYVKNYCKINGIPCKSLQKSKTESLKLRIKEDTSCIPSKTSYMNEDGMKNGIYYFGDPKEPEDWRDVFKTKKRRKNTRDSE